MFSLQIFENFYEFDMYKCWKCKFQRSIPQQNWIFSPSGPTMGGPQGDTIFIFSHGEIKSCIRPAQVHSIITFIQEIIIHDVLLLLLFVEEKCKISALMPFLSNKQHNTVFPIALANHSTLCSTIYDTSFASKRRCFLDSLRAPISPSNAHSK